MWKITVQIVLKFKALWATFLLCEYGILHAELHDVSSLHLNVHIYQNLIVLVAVAVIVVEEEEEEEEEEE